MANAMEKPLHGMYRCPVCGHRDGTDVSAGQPARQIVCSNCSSPLQVSARDARAVFLSVQLSDDRSGATLRT